MGLGLRAAFAAGLVASSTLAGCAPERQRER